MDQYQKQLITRNFYLQQMGAISLKADRAAKRIVEDEKDAAVNDTVQDVASDDSLSETRPLPADTESSASDCGEPDQLLHAAGGREARDGPPTANPLAAALGIGRKAGAKKKPSQARKQLCPKCKHHNLLLALHPLHHHPPLLQGLVLGHLVPHFSLVQTLPWQELGNNNDFSFCDFNVSCFQF